MCYKIREERVCGVSCRGVLCVIVGKVVGISSCAAI